MTLTFTLRQKLGLLLFVLATGAVAIAFAARTGAPGFPSTAPLRVHATLDDVQGLARGSDVLVRGVRVGTVSALAGAPGGRTRVTLDLDQAREALHRDATAAVGAKTPLGEAYVDLRPGRRGPPPADGGTVRGRPAVEVDEALRVLDAPARADLTGVLDESARALRSPAAAERLSTTIAALHDAVDDLDHVATALRGQDAVLAGAVQGARSVLSTLAARGPQLTGLVVDARRTLAAVGGRRAQLDASLRALPPLLSEADATLRTVAPLTREATPLAHDLRTAARPLRTALAPLPATLREGRVLLDRAPALERAARPALTAARPALAAAVPVAQRLGPLMANLVPIARFLGPRGNTAAAWFANTADLGAHGDAKGRWARFFILFDPSTVLGLKGGDPPGNAYTAPGDAASNQAYAKGGHPRLTPYRQAIDGQ